MPTIGQWDDGQWHLDKRIPISIIVAIILNTGFGVWYASSLNTRVLTLESVVLASSKTNAEDHDMLIRVEDKINEIADRLGVPKASVRAP